MQENTTSETIEWKTTIYSCDQEGCDFTTETKSDADQHYGKEHAIAEVGYASSETFYRFDSKENFDAYTKANDIGDRHFHWDGMGWYRSFSKKDTRGCSCCYDDYQHLHPACWIGFDWQKKIKGYRERLTELAKFLGEDGEFLLEDD